jgi:hypothetical protein
MWGAGVTRARTLPSCQLSRLCVLEGADVKQAARGGGRLGGEVEESQFSFVTLVWPIVFPNRSRRTDR